jgi:hypothetical protein
MTADRYPFNPGVPAGYLGRALAVIFLLAMMGPALAYRPFDGTDAAVAEKGELEVELQPAGIRRDGDENVLIAPAFVLNFGFAKGWEAILQGQVETPLSTWKVDDNLSFDFGVRKALMDNRNVTELRLGLTVGFPGLLNGVLPRK